MAEQQDKPQPQKRSLERIVEHLGGNPQVPKLSRATKEHEGVRPTATPEDEDPETPIEKIIRAFAGNPLTVKDKVFQRKIALALTDIQALEQLQQLADKYQTTRAEETDQAYSPETDATATAELPTESREIKTKARNHLKELFPEDIYNRLVEKNTEAKTSSPQQQARTN